MPEKIVFTDKKKRITLLGPVKTGGEGAIYIVKNEPGLCAKIYFKDKINTELQSKIIAMIKNPPGENLTGHKKSLRSSSISWPVSVLYESSDKNAQFAGFTMPLVDTSLFNEAHMYYDPQDRMKNLGGSFSWLYLLTAAFNISYVVSQIHKKGHRIGDMSATNILIARTAAVSIIDCDSFQIDDAELKKTYYTKVATGDFLPPELMGKNFREENIDRYYSDLFALGVIIFKLLMNGYHPFQARGKKVSDYPTIEQKIVKGFFPYAFSSPDLLPPKNAPPYEIISPQIRELFSRCFIAGHKYKNHRPSAEEWAVVLRSELAKIQQCRENSNHCYLPHLNYCPWCRIKKAGKEGSDLFPPDKNEKKPATAARHFADFNRPAKIYTPVLKVSPARVELRPVNTEYVKFCLEIENGGDGILSGNISSDRRWIIIKNPDISTADKTPAEIIVDKTQLFYSSGGIKFAGNINISTNGGKLTVPVTVAAGKNPKAEASVKNIMLKRVKKGDVIKKTVLLCNTGDGLLEGFARSQKSWLEVTPKNFKTLSQQAFEIAIDTKLCDSDILALGKIIFETNGKDVSVSVGLTFSD